MGILASHVPVIEQLKAGLVEIFEEGGSSKQFFRMRRPFFFFSLSLLTHPDRGARQPASLSLSLSERKEKAPILTFAYLF